MVGTDQQPIQVDENYFAARGKYNCGRFREGDRKSIGEQDARQELEIEMAAWESIDPSGDSGDEFAGRLTRRTNYRGRAVGPWVVVV